MNTTDFQNPIHITLSVLESYRSLKIRETVLREDIRRAADMHDALRVNNVDIELIELRELISQIESAVEHYLPPNKIKDDSAYMEYRTFLRCRYIIGMTMEQTSEVMNLSRDSAFRLRRKVMSIISADSE